MKTQDLLGGNISLVTPAQAAQPDHEVQMARSDLYKAGKYAIDLHNILKSVGETQGLEGWVQAKITKAADYLESVYHYLDYEMKSRGAMAEGAPTGPSGPIAPGAVPVGGAVGPSVAPAQAAAMAAKGRIDQKKAIEAKIKDLEMQKQQLQRQLAQAGQVQETTSAGAIASSMGGNGMGKKKKEIGSLFGGTYKQNESAKPDGMPGPRSMKRAGQRRVKEVADKYDLVGDQLKGMFGTPQLPGPKDPMDPRNMRIGLDKKIMDPNEPLDPATIRLTPADRIREAGRKKQKIAPHSNAPVKEGLKDPEDNPCWKGYHPVGTKKKNGRTVPNCVPGRSDEAANPAQQAAIAISKKKSGKYDKDGERIKEQGVTEGEVATYSVSVMDSATGEHWSIEVKATSPEAARERAEARGYKVLSVKEKQGVKEGETSDTTWKVTYDYGPHQSNTIHVKAKSSDDAWQAAKKEAAEKHHHSRIMAGQVTQVKDNVKEGKRIREDDDLNRVTDIRNKMNAATDPAEKSRLQQQYDMVTSTFNRIPPTSFPATDQATKQAQPTSEAGAPKFTGYWKGTDKGKPGKKMVGSD